MTGMVGQHGDTRHRRATIRWAGLRRVVGIGSVRPLSESPYTGMRQLRPRHGTFARDQGGAKRTAADCGGRPNPTDA